MRRPGRAGEAKDLIGDTLAALNSVQDVLDGFAQVACGAPANDLEVGLNAHQDVVEFMGDGRGDSPQAAHALRLRELLSQLGPLGDVRGRAYHTRGASRLVANDVATIENVGKCPVPPPHPVLLR